MQSTQTDSDRVESTPYPDLERVELHRNQVKERRKNGWPTIWRRRDHPQWLPGAGETANRREAFVYICDTTPQGMKKSLELGARMEAPGLGDEAIQTYGTLTVRVAYASTLTIYVIRDLWVA